MRLRPEFLQSLGAYQLFQCSAAGSRTFLAKTMEIQQEARVAQMTRSDCASLEINLSSEKGH